MKYFIIVLLIAVAGCQKPKEKPMEEKSELQKKIDAYAKIEINVKMDHLSPREKELVNTLVKAGEIADEIFWKQTAYDAAAVRDMLKSKTDKASKEALEFVMINYGPDDREDRKRFIGDGPQGHPDGAAFHGLLRLDSPLPRPLNARHPRRGSASDRRGRSSDGRALQSHCRGQGFDSPRLHQSPHNGLVELG